MLRPLVGAASQFRFGRIAATFVLALGACASGQSGYTGGPPPKDGGLDAARDIDATGADGASSSDASFDSGQMDASGSATHLLLSEIVMTPATAEYVEIY